jgi:hypothetical protein
LKFCGEEWDAGRMIFSEEDSAMFPGKKELVAFWYDDCHAGYEDHIALEGELQDPTFEHV